MFWLEVAALRILELQVSCIYGRMDRWSCWWRWVFHEEWYVKIFTGMSWVTTMCSVTTGQDIWIQQRTQHCSVCPWESPLQTCQSRESDLMLPREHLPWAVLRSPHTQHTQNRTQSFSRLRGATSFPCLLELAIAFLCQWQIGPVSVQSPISIPSIALLSPPPQCGLVITLHCNSCHDFPDGLWDCRFSLISPSSVLLMGLLTKTPAQANHLPPNLQMFLAAYRITSKTVSLGGKALS